MEALLSDKQWRDVFSLHICSLLQPRDLQALGQTCAALRHLTLHCLPASTWEGVAANTLPAAHPLLSVPGSETRSCLERIARAKALLPKPTVLGVGEGQAAKIRWALVINHQGTQVIMREGDAVNVYQLNLEDAPPTMELIGMGLGAPVERPPGVGPD
ncbi:hypothetical protein WJX73_006681 [Symbiochloris irregularis]|uniref:F-box domain-containing protein n=1 Tax=Symbiochloris irregularis TaxID=706552 RepID=A0AAW1NR77_9CHLO